MSRLVAKNHSQKPGTNFCHIHGPFIKCTTLRLVLTWVMHHRLKMLQVDGYSAFLNGDLQEDLYIQQPEVYVQVFQYFKVVNLCKALYGSRKA